MKKSFVVVFLLAALTLTLLAGCQSANADNPIAASASFTPLMQQQVLETPTPQQPLTAEEAEALALAHAGLTREEVVFDRTETDLEKGKQVFEVEFRSGDFEYDYTIDTTTGQVLHWEKEHDPEKPAMPEKPVTPEVPAEPEKPAEPEVPVDPEKPVEPEVPIEPEKPVEPEKKPLTAQEAEAIALAHAGLTREEVVFDRTETDREDGRQVFEVEFRKGNWEYSYEIDAETGKILEWEKEYDD